GPGEARRPPATSPPNGEWGVGNGEWLTSLLTGSARGDEGRGRGGGRLLPFFVPSSPFPIPRWSGGFLEREAGQERPPPPGLRVAHDRRQRAVHADHGVLGGDQVAQVSQDRLEDRPPGEGPGSVVHAAGAAERQQVVDERLEALAGGDEVVDVLEALGAELRA